MQLGWDKSVFYFQKSADIGGNDKFAFTELQLPSKSVVNVVFVESTLKLYSAPKKLAVILYHELIHGNPHDNKEEDAWRATGEINKALGRPFAKSWIYRRALAAGVTLNPADL